MCCRKGRHLFFVLVVFSSHAVAGARHQQGHDKHQTLSAAESLSSALGAMKNSIDEKGFIDGLVSESLGAAKGKLDGWIEGHHSRYPSDAAPTSGSFDWDETDGRKMKNEAQTPNNEKKGEARAKRKDDIDWSDVGNSIKEGFSEVDWKGVGRSMKEGLEEVDWKKAGNSVREGVAAVDWKGIGKSISDGVKQVDWEEIGRSVSSTFPCDGNRNNAPSDDTAGERSANE